MAVDLDVEEYMAKFDAIEADVGKLRDLADVVLRPINPQIGDHRLDAVMHYVKVQQNFNESIHDMLVSMNNFFAPK